MKNIPIINALELFNRSNERKALSSESIRYYRENLSRFSMWLASQNVKKVRQLNKTVIDEYEYFLSRTSITRTSLNTYMRAVRRFIYFLSGENYIDRFSVELAKDEPKIKPTFDSAEVERILASVDPFDKVSVIMLVLLSCGIRSRTLCSLNVRDIFFADGYINFNVTKNGIPQCQPISPAVLSCLRDYIRAHRLLPNDILFPNAAGKRLNRSSLGKLCNKRLRELGVPNYKSGVHIFRHTFGKFMSMHGCPTAVLQKWLGHSDIKITQRYINLYGNELKLSMNMLPTSSFCYKPV